MVLSSLGKTSSASNEDVPPSATSAAVGTIPDDNAEQAPNQEELKVGVHDGNNEEDGGDNDQENQQQDDDDEEDQEPQEEEEDQDQDDDPSSQQQPIIKLYKSPRLKGYITIALASVINYNAAILSTDPIASNSVPASPTQQRYAKAVSLVSAIITGFLVLVHLDRYTPLQPIWKKMFAHNSKIELLINILLFFWWFVATIVQTSVRGIAGDGKEQYNLYYSTWVCCWTAMWTVERKLMEDKGWVSLRTFITSWPYRAPGWIAIWISCFFTLFWYLDLFLNTASGISQNDNANSNIPETLRPFYSTIPRSQYQWLLFVAAITLLPSSVFIFAEIFRETNNNNGNNSSGSSNNGQQEAAGGQQQQQPIIVQKGALENILEGFILLLLSIGWIPSVIVATTPGGFASLVGNAYFFTWLTTVFVMETSIWFVQDFRASVHRALEEKELEYKQQQQKVLQQSRQQIIAASSSTSNNSVCNSGNYLPNNIPPPTSRPPTSRSSSRSSSPALMMMQQQQQTQQQQQQQNRQPPHHRHHHSYTFDDIVDEDTPVVKRLRFGQDEYDEVDEPPKFYDGNMGDDYDRDGNLDDNSLERELRFKERNKVEYFDTLNDILE